VIVKKVDAKTRAKTSLNDCCAGTEASSKQQGDKMSAMKRLFQVMADKKASDIFLSVGAPINIKLNGVAMPVNQTVMTAETVQQLLYEVLNERQIKEFEDEMELNTAYNLAGVGTFRISAMRQKGSPAVVVRYIPGPFRRSTRSACPRC
jgi:twitching motility protein PilU